MRNLHQGLCPIFCNSTAAQLFVVPDFPDATYSKRNDIFRQWRFFNHRHATCGIKPCINPQILREVYRKPSLDPIGRYVMLLHDPITAVYQISYLGVYAFRYIRDGIPSIHYQFCYCFGILGVCLFRAVIIKLFDLLDGKRINHYQGHLMISHIFCQCKPVMTGRLAAY